MGLTEMLAVFAAEVPATELPAATLESAKRLVLDTFGVTLAASNRRIGKIITRHVADAGAMPTTATVIGGGIRVAPSLAALANGTMAHALALDGGNHLPTHILPAALALTEHHHRSGRDLLDAVIVAFEVGSKLTQAIGRGPTSRGWWHVGLVGPIAAAIAAGRLLKLGRQEMAMAIGIATCSSAGLRRNMGTMSQAYHSGNAARAGIEAAQLTAIGFTGDPEIIEAPLGFLAGVCLPDEVANAPIIDRLARPYSLEREYGIKPYPVCGPAQPLIEAIKNLRLQESFSMGDIEAVEADLHYFSLLRPNPTDEDSAGYSGAYTLAAALVHGEVWIDEISEEAVNDPRIRTLMRLVTHVPSARKNTDRVVIKLRGGKELSAEIVDGGDRPATSEVGETKFHRCAERVLSSKAADELMDIILGLESRPTIDRMMAVAGGRS